MSTHGDDRRAGGDRRAGDWVADRRGMLQRMEAVYLEADAISLADYWRMLYTRRWLILFLAVCSGAAASWFSDRITPRYETSGEFYIPTDVATPIPGPEGGRLRLPGPPDLAQLYSGLLQSGATLQAVAAKVAGRSPAEIGNNIDVAVSSSAAIRVYARDHDPAMALRIVQELIQAFQAFHRDAATRDLDATLAAVGEQLGQLERDREALRAERLAFAAENDIGSLNIALQEIEARRAQHEAALRAAELDLAVARERVAATRDQLDQIDTGVRRGQVSSALADSLYRELRGELARAEVAQRIASTQLETVRGAGGGLSDEVQALQRQRAHIEDLDERIALLTRSITAANDRLTGLRAARRQLPEAVLVTSEPALPTAPIYPLKLLNVAVAVVGGLVVGILYALLLDYIARRQRIGRVERLRREEWARHLMRDLADGGLLR
ncbi:MAG: hypothetical protein H6983_17435 [Ectothiorhodospiraceae bacterium]|nr:hypothetical protein [Chromatiales bacterium]MCP5155958.1 hypothetical protein [Ectothiorhodospiraceae bacterium]